MEQRALLPPVLKNLFFPPEKDEYAYFLYAKEYPFGEPCIAKAAWAADLAMLAYARYGQARMSEQELSDNLQKGGLTLQTRLGDWNAPGTQGFFAAGDGFAFLAFRGTEADDKQDAFDDADILPVPEMDRRSAPRQPGLALAHLSVAMHHLLPCLVHKGFQRALDSVWNGVHLCVTEYRRAHPDAEICFTGHSLGAALALLAFSRFSDDNHSLYTFGCPRVGDQAFQNRALSNPGRGIYRIVNFNDTVAHVPLESFLYKHTPPFSLRFDEHGALAKIESGFSGDLLALETAVAGLHWDWSMDLSRIPAPDGIVDHSPARYCIRLSNLLSGASAASLEGFCGK